MTNKLCKLVALVLFTMALAGAACAQDYSHKVRADIPFNFYAGSKLLPAGTYTFATNTSTHSVMIANSGKGFESFVQGSPNDGSNKEVALLTIKTNDAGVYALQKVQGQDFGISFNTGKAPANMAADQSPEATRTVTAQLLK